MVVRGRWPSRTSMPPGLVVFYVLSLGQHPPLTRVDMVFTDNHSFFLFRNFKFLIFFYELFSFSLTWDDIEEKISNNISSESTHQIHSQKSCILIGTVSTKVVQRNAKFQILDFCPFFVCFPWHGTMIWGVNLQTTYPLKEHTKFAPKNSCMLLERVSQHFYFSVCNTASELERGLHQSVTQTTPTLRTQHANYSLFCVQCINNTVGNVFDTYICTGGCWKDQY